MNKKLHLTEITGSPGLYVFNSDQTSSMYHNGETFDVTKTVTNVQLDQSYLMTQISNQMTLLGPKLVEDNLQRLIKEKIRFDMVSWTNEDGLPEVTCQLFYGDKLIEEKTTHIANGKTESVASPA